MSATILIFPETGATTFPIVGVNPNPSPIVPCEKIGSEVLAKAITAPVAGANKLVVSCTIISFSSFKVSAFIYLDLNIILVCTSYQYIFMKKLTFLLNQYFIVKNIFLYLSNQVYIIKDKGGFLWLNLKLE